MTEFNRDRFAEVVGSKFSLTAGDVTIDLELIEVSKLRETPHQVGFSLLFLAPKGYSIQQSLYDLEHETLGAMQLFLVPVAVENERMQLEAVFNLLRSKDAPANE